jgi:hypothetical protein
MISYLVKVPSDSATTALHTAEYVDRNLIHQFIRRIPVQEHCSSFSFSEAETHTPHDCHATAELRGCLADNRAGVYSSSDGWKTCDIFDISFVRCKIYHGANEKYK